MSHPGRYFHTVENGALHCDLCPRGCEIAEGRRGFCYVRKNEGGQMVLTTYGRSSGFCIDPIEKKPLNHYLPGTPVLSFGTVGCNLGCQFCQNWDISKSREMETLQDEASPEKIAKVAKLLGCRSVAFTYNDPVIFLEYAVDIAQACREVGINTVAVSAGYMTDQSRPEFFSAMDAANIDLKAFTEDFYLKITKSHIHHVLDTLQYLKHETKVWFEITTLLIPDANDSNAEIEEMTQWIYNNLGPDVPLHFSAFHPDYKMMDNETTPDHTLFRARDIALKNGLNYVYSGNIFDPPSQSTYCPTCKALLVKRDWHNLYDYNIHDGACKFCHTQIPGHFENTPGTWGRRRENVNLSGFAFK